MIENSNYSRNVSRNLDAAEIYEDGWEGELSEYDAVQVIKSVFPNFFLRVSCFKICN